MPDRARSGPFAAAAMLLFSVALRAQTVQDTRPLTQATPEDLAAGKRTYGAQCAVCHGMDGSGGYGPSLLVPVLPRASDDEGLIRVVSRGIPGLMPGFGSANGPRRSWQLAAYVRSLAAATAAVVIPGDAARGKAVYQERGCARCHVLGGVGRAFGPDLSHIGAQRGPAYIRQALLEPGARVPDGHVVVTAHPKDARALRGVRIAEDVFWVYVRDPGGRLHRYWKPELARLEREAGASLMPAFGARRGPDEIDDLVAYLASLRGQR